MGATRTCEELVFLLFLLLFFLLFFAGVSSAPSEAPGADKSWKGEAGKDRGTDPHGDVDGSLTQGYIWHHI